MVRANGAGDPNQNTINSYGARSPKDMELMDKNWNPIFEKTLKKLGQLKVNEMCG